MKARDILVGLLGFILGIVAGVIIYKKRKELIYRLETLLENVQESQFYEKTAHYITDIRQSLFNLIENSKQMPREKEDEILTIVEEKIKRLEDIIKSER